MLFFCSVPDTTKEINKTGQTQKGTNQEAVDAASLYILKKTYRKTLLEVPFFLIQILATRLREKIWKYQLLFNTLGVSALRNENITPR
jgi:hypothetical protein